MLTCCTRFLLRRNLTGAAISASLLLPKQFSADSQHTLLRFSSSPSIKAEFPSPVWSFRSNRTMASQSGSKSVHDFTVKVRFWRVFIASTSILAMNSICLVLTVWVWESVFDDLTGIASICDLCVEMRKAALRFSSYSFLNLKIRQGLISSIKNK